MSGSNITFDGLCYDGAPCADPLLDYVSQDVLLVLNGSPITYAIVEAQLTIEQGTNKLYFLAASEGIGDAGVDACASTACAP